MPLADLDQAQSAMSGLLASLAAADWTRATPCEQWDVTAVVRHLCTGDRAFVTSLGGVPYELPVIAEELAAVSVGSLPAAYADGAVRLREALDSAGDEAFPSGIGPMRASEIAELRTIESLVHGWDVARAVGSSLAVDPAVADRAIGHSLALMERLPADRTPFGPRQPVADDALALDRLVALLGRSPGWVSG
jgi:uncharacterized protein (TIGR03086 family)